MITFIIEAVLFLMLASFLIGGIIDLIDIL